MQYLELEFKQAQNEMDIIYILGAQKPPRNYAGNIETTLFAYSPCGAMGLRALV